MGLNRVVTHPGTHTHYTYPDKHPVTPSKTNTSYTT